VAQSDLPESKISEFLGRCGDTKRLCHAIPFLIEIILSLVDLSPVLSIVQYFNHPILEMAVVRTKIDL
jgi:hypothetical protein